MSGHESTRAVWGAAVTSEIEFWRQYLKTRGLSWPDEYAMRLDPRAPLNEQQIASRLELFADETIRILDVGAGPLTVLGKVAPGKRLEIHPTDALAESYAQLLSELHLNPPVPTIRCDGEDLHRKFPPAYFHFAYARNALDHCYDPVQVIRNMVSVTRVQGWIILRHRPNEAVTAGYAGLHQWNFERSGDDTRVWTAQTSVSLRDEFHGVATISTHDDGEWIVTVLQRQAIAAG